MFGVFTSGRRQRRFFLAPLQGRTTRLHLEQLEDRRMLSAAPFEIASPASAWFRSMVDPVELNESGQRFLNTSAESGSAGETLEDSSRWIVQLNDDGLAKYGSVEEVAMLFQESGVEVLYGLGLPGQVLVGASSATSDETSRFLEDHSLVSHFRMDGVGRGSVLPDDPLFSVQAGLNNTGQDGNLADADIDAPEAWDTGTGSRNVIVAVIDSGVAYDHPDLVHSIWINQGEIPAALQQNLLDVDEDGLISFVDLNHASNADHVTDINDNGLIDAGDLVLDSDWSDQQDNDGNQFIDDLVGWDFLNHDPLPEDQHGHGTHVSGIIGAEGNNGVGISGVNWTSSIMPLRFLDENNFGYLSNGILAINYATMMRLEFGANVRVINNSWGTPLQNQNLLDAIQANGQSGMLMVNAAGNGNYYGGYDLDDSDYDQRYFPASIDSDHIITVGATSLSDGSKAFFSNFGATTVDLLAPGTKILSTDLAENGLYRLRSGTSMATPFVSGVAALIWSRNPTARPLEVKAAILQSVDSISGLEPLIVSGGSLNAKVAVELDTFSPHVELQSINHVFSGGSDRTSFEVRYGDNQGVDENSVRSQNVTVRRVSRDAPPLGVEVGQVTVENGGESVLVRYDVLSPGSEWKPDDNDEYEIILNGGEISDASANYAPTEEIAILRVSLSGAAHFNVNTTLDELDNNVGNGIALTDNGTVSLRAAVQEANATPGHNTIYLPEGTYALGVSGSASPDTAAQGDLDITGDITIIGSGSVTITTAMEDRLFDLHVGTTVMMIGLSITSGDVDGDGGGIRVDGGTLRYTTGTIYQNSATRGGAIAAGNGSEIYLSNVTLSTNTADDQGGAVFLDDSKGTFRNLTITANVAARGGGVVNEAAELTFSNTLVAGNQADASPDVFGAIISSGNNILGINEGTTGVTNGANGDIAGTSAQPVEARLGPLDFDSGLFPTHELLVGSPAIDAGSSEGVISTDQRGISRFVDGNKDGNSGVDIGAVERYFVEINGTKYNDLDGSGTRDEGEPGLPDWIVYLDLNSNGQLDLEEPLTVTDRDGLYSFNHLEPGEYTVADVGQSGWSETSPAAFAPSHEFHVNTTTDTVDVNPGDGVAVDGSGNISLRGAILEANVLPGPDTIYLDAVTYVLAIPGAGEDAGVSGDLDITDDLVIVGQGKDSTTIDANSLDRVIQVSGDVNVTIRDVTITGGRLAGGRGAGVYGSSDGNPASTGLLTLENVRVIDNQVLPGKKLEFVYWVADGNVYRSEPDGSAQQVVFSATGQQHAEYVDVDSNNATVYVRGVNPATSANVLWRSSLEGTGVVDIKGDIPQGESFGFTVSPASGHIFYHVYSTDDAVGGIYRVDLDGTNELKFPFNSLSVFDMEVDAGSGHLYFSDRQSYAGIQRVNLDGTGLVSVTNESDAPSQSEHLALDLDNQALFITRADKGIQQNSELVARYGIDGSGFSPIVSGFDGLDVDYDPVGHQLFVISPTKIIRTDPATGQLIVVMEFAREDWGQTASRSIALYHSENAERLGGGVASEIALRLDSSVISENKSSDGGGIWVSSSVEISASSVVYNEAQQVGGGIHVSGTGHGSIVSSTIAENVADRAGGVLVDSTSAQAMLIYSSTITFNEAVTEHGLSIATGSNVELQSSIVANSRSSDSSTPVSDITGDALSRGNNAIGILGESVGLSHGVQGDLVGDRGATALLDFSTDPSWTAVNTTHGGNSYGFSAATSFAGSEQGELGGHFTPSDTVKYYADTEGIQSLDRNDRIFASGVLNATELDMSGSLLRLGHFSTENESAVFVHFGGTNTNSLALSGCISSALGTVDLGTECTGNVFVNRNNPVSWSYEWTPNTEDFSSAGMEFTFAGSTVSISNEKLVDLDRIDAFGFFQEATNANGKYLDLYIDDLEYTVEKSRLVVGMGPLQEDSNTGQHVAIPTFESVVIDASDADASPTVVDQVGNPRHVDLSNDGVKARDVGAVEFDWHTVQVTTTNDTVDANPGDGLFVDADGNVSLRSAIMEATALIRPVHIQLAGETYQFTIAGGDENNSAKGDLDVRIPLKVSGTSPAETIIDADGLDRVFHLPKDTTGLASLMLESITIRGGNAGTYGGGIFNNSGGNVLLDTVHVTENHTSYMGGGIVHSAADDGYRRTQLGLLTVLNSAITSNTGGDGGIYVFRGALVVENSTISNNVGGIASWPYEEFFLSADLNHVTIVDNVGYDLKFADITDVTMRNSLVAYNKGELGHGQIDQASHSIIGIDDKNDIVHLQDGNLKGTASQPLDIKYLPLQAGSNSIPYHPLAADSPAVDAASIAGYLPRDQAGTLRPLDGNSDGLPRADMGASEFGQNGSAPVTVNDTYVIRKGETLELPGTLSRYQDFSTDPGWSIRDDSQNTDQIGLSATTSFAGSAPGEIGGRFTQSTNSNYVVDADFASLLSLDDKVSAEGKLDVIDFFNPSIGKTTAVPTGLYLGHVATAGRGRLGIGLSNDDAGSRLFWSGIIRFDDNMSVQFGTTEIQDVNQNHTWQYDWTPSGGEHGAGSFLVSLDGTEHQYDLTTLERQKLVTNLNAFGLFANAAEQSQPGNYVELYIDDAFYGAGTAFGFMDNDSDPDGVGQKLYFADAGTYNGTSHQDGIYANFRRANLDGTQVEDILIGDVEYPDVRALHYPTQIAVDPINHNIYWTDTNVMRLKKADFSGENIELLDASTETYQGIGITIDPIHEKVYWLEKTQNDDDRLRRINFDGTNKETLLNSGIPGPMGLAIDVKAERLFWTETEDNKIFGSNLDGGDVEVIFSNDPSKITEPFGIAVDPENQHIYWAERLLGQINRIRYDGSDFQVIVDNLGEPQGLAIDRQDGKLYWTDRVEKVVKRANLDGTGIETILDDEIYEPLHISLDLTPGMTPTVLEEPRHGQFTLQDHGTFQYTPDSDFSGVDTIVYQLSDGVNLSSEATVTIEVIDLEQPVVELEPVGYWKLQVQPGEVVGDLDFGSQGEPGSISGMVFDDVDRNTYKTVNESGIAGITVFIDVDGNGGLDAEEPSVVTLSDGLYQFDDLAPFVSYTIRQVNHDDWYLSSPPVTENSSWVVPLLPSQLLEEFDFANHSTSVQGVDGEGRISGRMFEDVDGNGIQNGNEAGISGSVVYLDLNRNGQLDTEITNKEPSTTTDSNGDYLFENLQYATYHVATVDTATHAQSLPRASSLVSQRLETKQKTKAVEIADFNGDGLKDLIYGKKFGMELYLATQTADGDFVDSATLTLGGAGTPTDIGVADFNGDDYIDIVATNWYGQSVSVFVNKGDGSFHVPVQYAVSQMPKSIVIEDLDADGDVDFVVSSDFDNSITVLLNNGSGIFTTHWSTVVDSRTRNSNSVAAGLIDSDANVDLVVANDLAGSVTIFAGDGNGGFSSSGQALRTGRRPVQVRLADLNQDTYLDIVTVNVGNGNLSLLLSTGQGNYAPALSIPVEGIPASLEISDMNMDLLPDLVVGILGQPKVQVIHNDGDGRFPVSRSYGLTRLIFYAHDIAVDDLDNDGDPDIVSVEAGRYVASNQDLPPNDQSIDLSASVHSILFNNPEPTTQSVSLFGGRKDVEQIQFAEIRMLPPTMTAISNIAIDEGSGEQTVSLTGITAGGGESQPLKITATSSNTNLVPNPTVTYTSPEATGSLKFTPVGNAHGTATITVTVEDGGPDGNLETLTDNATAEVLFSVVVNSLPVANDGSLTTPDSTVLVRNAQNGLASLVDDADNDTLSFSVVTDPAHGDLTLASDGSFTYSPDTRFNRVDSFIYKASDGRVDSNVATMTITIDTSYAWYNYKKPRDVDEDNGIHPVDALYIIDAFHSGVATDLPNDRPRPLTKPFYDVNWDSKLTLADAQEVIDWINNPPSGDGEAEGEAFYSSRWKPASFGQWRTDVIQAQSPVLSAESLVVQLDDACRSLQPAAAVLDLVSSRSVSQPQLVDQVLEGDLDSLLEDELAELLQ